MNIINSEQLQKYAELKEEVEEAVEKRLKSIIEISETTDLCIKPKYPGDELSELSVYDNKVSITFSSYYSGCMDSNYYTIPIWVWDDPSIENIHAWRQSIIDKQREDSRKFRQGCEKRNEEKERAYLKELKEKYEK